MSTAAAANTTDLLFTGKRVCARCGVTVGYVVTGQWQPRKNYGGVVKGQKVCREHMPKRRMG